MIQIDIYPVESFSPLLEQFQALAKIFDIELQILSEEDPGQFLFIPGAENKVPPEIIKNYKRCLWICESSPEIKETGYTVLNFVSESHGCHIFAGHGVPHHSLRISSVFDTIAKTLKSQEIIATVPGQPVWLRGRFGETLVDLIGARPIAPLNPTRLWNNFSNEQFFGLLPILEFFRLANPELQTPSPITASLMVDDPNLHAQSYGYINYQNLILDARQKKYHVAFATVPLDMYWENKKAVQDFKSASDCLSLLIHGIHHTKAELANLGNLAQAENRLHSGVERILRFEKRTGLHVSRVMAPPHGACGGNAFRAMNSAGIKSVTISHGSLRKWNSERNWLADEGFGRATFIDNLPVLHRFRLSDNCIGNILTAAYLGQPLIPVGHHEECADGLRLFGRVADQINSLGNVQWTDLETITNSNYQVKINESTLTLIMWSGEVSMAIPPEVKNVIVQRPWMNRLAKTNDSVTLFNTDNLNENRKGTRSSLEYELRDSGILKVRSITKDQSCLRIKPNSWPGPWPLIRRFLAEIKDRTKPCAVSVKSRFIS